MRWDAIVVGAGVVGLACAERLARGGRSVVVIERHESFGRETSSRSSQVVHAGLYYPKGSWKARLCVAGRRLLHDWCARKGVEARAIGKLVVASDDADIGALDALAERARDNGVEDLERLGAREIALREPDVIAREALWSPSSGIVDAHALMASLVAEARASARCDVAYRHEVIAVSRAGSEHALRVRDASGGESEVRAPVVVNAAGLSADELSSAAGIDVDAARYRQRWVKGRYCRVRRREGRGPRVRSLVYPVPPPGLTGLGVHLTLELDGGMRLGPDVEVLEARRMDVRVPDELASSFHAAASRFLRGLALEDVVPDQAGIRPKLVASEGEVRDFVIAEESARGLPGWVSLVGIESPGLTASLAIAERVGELVG